MVVKSLFLGAITTILGLRKRLTVSLGIAIITSPRRTICRRVQPDREAGGQCMSVEKWALIASVVFTGLFSGLTAMLVLILHRMMLPMSGPDFARF
jgi:hypothetical protein